MSNRHEEGRDAVRANHLAGSAVMSTAYVIKGVR
jgi:hypothetical protein